MVAAEAAGEIPPGIVSDEGLTTVDDMIMSGPFRGCRKADSDRSKVGEETRRILIDLANQDSFMKSLLDRRLNSRLDSERIRVREEEVDKVEGRVRKRVADEVREEVVVQVREELKPDLDRVEEERNRFRNEERAVLQRQYDELAEKRQEIEEERLRVREEEMARVRVEFAINVGAENAAPGGAGGTVEVGAPEEVDVVDHVVAAPAAGVEEEPLVEAIGAGRGILTWRLSSL